jgi:hypothetical protein
MAGAPLELPAIVHATPGLCRKPNISRAGAPGCLPDLESLLSFAGSLFGLARASADNVRDELQRFFAVQIDDTGAHLPWALAYARGTKPR